MTMPSAQPHILETTAGILPSPSWLSRQFSTQPEILWNEILNSDLRDVCESNVQGCPAAKQVRDGIVQSLSVSNNNKSVLPTDFKLMVQIEEVVDGTLSGEQRLARGHESFERAGIGSDDTANPSSTSSSFPDRSNNYRSFKMVLSDGYSLGRNITIVNLDMVTTSTHPTLLTAMETSPLSSLTPTTPPGTKLILHGPIIIRHGMLQLNDGNALLVGGGVDGWEDICRAARERAERRAGLGVDPTIKALCWNPIIGEEKDADEGEGESGDVVTPPIPTLAPRSVPLVSARPTPNDPSNTAGIARPTVTPNASSLSNSNHASAIALGSNITRQNAMDSHSTNTVSGGGSTKMNPYQRHSNDMNGFSSADSVMNGIDRQSTAVTHAQRIQTPNRSGNVSINTPSHIARRSSAPNPYASLRPSFTSTISSSSPTSDGTSAMDITNCTNNDAPTTSSQETSTAEVSQLLHSTALGDTESFSLSELKEHLHRIRSDKRLYEQNFVRTFIVPCKLRSDDHVRVFDIVKVEKKKAKSEGKKHEFLFVCSFFGPMSAEGSIACRVESGLMESFFDGHSPTDIRKLQREEKERANRLVNASSTQFLHEYSFLAEIHLRLLLSPNDFFENTPKTLPNNWLEDLHKPVMLVVDRKTMDS